MKSRSEKQHKQNAPKIRKPKPGVKREKRKPRRMYAVKLVSADRYFRNEIRDDPADVKKGKLSHECKKVRVDTWNKDLFRATLFQSPGAAESKRDSLLEGSDLKADVVPVDKTGPVVRLVKDA